MPEGHIEGIIMSLLPIEKLPEGFVAPERMGLVELEERVRNQMGNITGGCG
jgi:hypothetical protein